MGIYYQKIGKNKSIEYNSNPSFFCPIALQAIKENQDDKDKYKVMGDSGQAHSNAVGNGENKRRQLSETEEQTPDGMVRTTKTLFYKASKEHPPICRCGQTMELRYVMWYKYTESRAKVNRVGGFAFRMAQNDKTYWTRYFRTRKARDKFWNKFIAKKTAPATV